MEGSSGANLQKDAPCFRNAQCASGFCDLGAETGSVVPNGQCSQPLKVGDPCNVSSGNCPFPLQCSAFSWTCTSRGPKSKEILSECSSGTDCAHGKICWKGQCKWPRLIQELCVPRSVQRLNANDDDSYRVMPCETGSVCMALEEASKVYRATVKLRYLMQPMPSDSDKDSNSMRFRCYELCSEAIPCPNDYRCAATEPLDPENYSTSKAVTSSLSLPQVLHVCVPKTVNSHVHSTSFKQDSHAAFWILVAVVFCAIALLAWIRLTRTTAANATDKKQKIRLNYEGNGMATITMVPDFSANSNLQPPLAQSLFPQQPPKYEDIAQQPRQDA
jgi:hypothetical protein